MNVAVNESGDQELIRGQGDSLGVLLVDWEMLKSVFTELTTGEDLGEYGENKLEEVFNKMFSFNLPFHPGQQRIHWVSLPNPRILCSGSIDR